MYIICNSCCLGYLIKYHQVPGHAELDTATYGHSNICHDLSHLNLSEITTFICIYICTCVHIYVHVSLSLSIYIYMDQTLSIHVIVFHVFICMICMCIYARALAMCWELHGEFVENLYIVNRESMQHS